MLRIGPRNQNFGRRLLGMPARFDGSEFCRLLVVSEVTDQMSE